MSADVRVGVVEAGSDDERLEELALRLREELLALEVESVQPAVAGAAPAGSRGGLAALAGVLTVSLAADHRNDRRRRGRGARLAAPFGRAAPPCGSRSTATRWSSVGRAPRCSSELVDDWIARHSVGATGS